MLYADPRLLSINEENISGTNIDSTHLLVCISAIISITGGSFYILDTIKGKTKPNRVTWIIWAVVPLLGTGAALSAGADIWTSIRVFLAGFLPLLVLIASFFNHQSYWKLSGVDYFCGLISILAIIVWGYMNNPIMAVLLLAIADGFAAIPTLIKAWNNPESETASTYAANLISVLIVLPSIKVWDIPNSAFQIYLLTANLLLLIFICRDKISAVFHSTKNGT